MKNSNVIQRYTASERFNHWFVALCFFLAALSGLAFFHPLFFWLSNLFGGGTWARILHPFFGTVMSILFLLWIARVWKENELTAADWEWAKHMQEIMQNKTDNLPPVGKFNFGQKMLTKTLLVAVLLLSGSGVMIWQPYFAQEFTVDTRRIAVLVHALSAFVAISGIIVHVYAAYWTRGAIRGMTQGFVSHKWAKHHCAGWYAERMGKEQ